MEVPTLQKLASDGVLAEYMKPAFPTLTFPNHYSIVTGLYPAEHGIVANTMYDPEFKAQFSTANREENTKARWWGGEPIWNTAEKQGIKAACFFWPGSEAPINGIRPSHWKPYNNDEPYQNRVDTVLSWLDIPTINRPRLITLYFSKTDVMGHSYGPASDSVRAAAKLVQGIELRKLQNQVNLIVVSDHGMDALSTERINFLDDYINMDWPSRTIFGEVTNFFVKPEKMDSLLAGFNSKPHPHFQVYKKSETPERWHFRDNRRIGDVVVVSEESWYNTTRSNFQKQKNTLIKGAHGWDNDEVNMRATFLAKGPAFAVGKTVPPFENINVYKLICTILGLQPANNHGQSAIVEGILKGKKWENLENKDN
jgi:predicted AlkP superfamily pyrophosphatase or phosphodiesterase